MKKMVCNTIVAFVILLFCTVDALGQEKGFPIKPINLYIGYSPGGGTANSGVIFAEGMKKHLRVPVIVNYKPGAAQLVAAEFMKNSNPDGYTLLYVCATELLPKLALESSTTKFRLDDLESLGGSPNNALVFAVNAESPWKNLEDLVAAAKKSPGSLSFASSGVGTHTHLLKEVFSRKAGIVLNHVPFAGSGPANTALLGGHVHIASMGFSGYAGYMQPGGGLRVLAVFDQKRDPAFPDVPTAMESGYDIVALQWYELAAPMGLPKSVRATLVQATESVAKDPEVISKLSKLGFNSNYLSPEEVNRKIQEGYKLCLDTWEKIGLTKK